jgi:hypothetical protein
LINAYVPGNAGGSNSSNEERTMDDEKLWDEARALKKAAKSEIKRQVSASARLPLLARVRIAIDKWRIAGEMKWKQARYGRFYVRYNDNEKSMPMDYSTAKDYADIFGGKVIHREFNCEC